MAEIPEDVEERVGEDGAADAVEAQKNEGPSVQSVQQTAQVNVEQAQTAPQPTAQPVQQTPVPAQVPNERNQDDGKFNAFSTAQNADRPVWGGNTSNFTHEKAVDRHAENVMVSAPVNGKQRTTYYFGNASGMNDAMKAASNSYGDEGQNTVEAEKPKVGPKLDKQTDTQLFESLQRTAQERRKQNAQTNNMLVTDAAAALYRGAFKDAVKDANGKTVRVMMDASKDGPVSELNKRLEDAGATYRVTGILATGSGDGDLRFTVYSVDRNGRRFVTQRSAAEMYDTRLKAMGGANPDIDPRTGKPVAGISGNEERNIREFGDFRGRGKAWERQNAELLRKQRADETNADLKRTAESNKYDLGSQRIGVNRERIQTNADLKREEMRNRREIEERKTIASIIAADAKANGKANGKSGPMSREEFITKMARNRSFIEELLKGTKIVEQDESGNIVPKIDPVSRDPMYKNPRTMQEVVAELNRMYDSHFKDGRLVEPQEKKSGYDTFMEYLGKQGIDVGAGANPAPAQAETPSASEPTQTTGQVQPQPSAQEAANAAAPAADAQAKPAEAPAQTDVAGAAPPPKLPPLADGYSYGDVDKDTGYAKVFDENGRHVGFQDAQGNKYVMSDIYHVLDRKGDGSLEYRDFGDGETGVYENGNYIAGYTKNADGTETVRSVVGEGDLAPWDKTKITVNANGDAKQNPPPADVIRPEPANVQTKPFVQESVPQSSAPSVSATYADPRGLMKDFDRLAPYLPDDVRRQLVRASAMAELDRRRGA